MGKREFYIQKACQSKEKLLKMAEFLGRIEVFNYLCVNH